MPASAGRSIPANLSVEIQERNDFGEALSKLRGLLGDKADDIAEGPSGSSRAGPRLDDVVPPGSAVQSEPTFGLLVRNLLRRAHEVP